MLPLAPALRSRSLASVRLFSTSLSSFAAETSTPTKAPIALIAELRKAHPIPLQQARAALEQNGNNLEKALSFLQSSSGSNSEAKAKKLSSRVTEEGTIAVSLLGGKRVSMIHLACETDFVARNDVFLKTAKGVAETAAFLDVPATGDELPSSIPSTTASPNGDPILEFPIDALSSAPLIVLPSSADNETDHPAPISHSSEPATIHQTLLSSLSLTGENLKLIRAVSFAAPFPSTPEVRLVPGCYAHGGLSDSSGKVAGIVVLKFESLDEKLPIVRMLSSSGGRELEKELSNLARSVARQVVGFPTKCIRAGSAEGVEEMEILEEQPFMMFGAEEKRVKDVLENWGQERGLGVRVVGMRRWSVDDALGSVEEVEATEQAASPPN